MHQILGRIVSRGEKICGIFVPLDKGLPEGIWEVRSVIMGDEFTLTKIGTPAMEPKRLQALDLNGLHSERAIAVMTQEEIDNLK